MAVNKVHKILEGKLWKYIFFTHYPHIIKTSEGLSVFLKPFFLQNPSQNFSVLKFMQRVFIVMVKDNKFHVGIWIFRKKCSKCDWRYTGEASNMYLFSWVQDAKLTYEQLNEMET